MWSLRKLAVLVLTISCGFGATAALAQSGDPKRAITQIAGDLYRFQNNFHYSVFLVTPDGVIVTDPIDAEAATWLKGQIQSRFGQPIRYVVYSHDHRDHSAGGEVFAADGAIVVAHENARRAIIEENRPTAIPQVTFNDRLALELGGKRMELIYPGKSHSDNLIVMHFPAERALFAVDMISVKRLPFKDLGDAYIPEWIDAIRAVEAIDFDILAPGHGPLGGKQDAVEHADYLQALHDAVLTGAREGKTLEELQASITLDSYKDWDQYEAWLPLNIEGMYRQVSLHRRGN